MGKEKGVIFDLDGTLYKLRGRDGTFGGSDLYAAQKVKMYEFIGQRLALDAPTARSVYEDLKEAYAGAVSVGIEQKYGVSRYEWFANTWNLPPADFIDPADGDVAAILRPFTGRATLLTSGPRAWAEPVLDCLGVAGVFGSNIITGEADARKPNPEVFVEAARMLGRCAGDMVSVGDQNHSDIVPARTLGMQTIVIGPEIASAHYRADNLQAAVEIIHEIERNE